MTCASCLPLSTSCTLPLQENVMPPEEADDGFYRCSYSHRHSPDSSSGSLLTIDAFSFSTGPFTEMQSPRLSDFRHARTPSHKPHPAILKNDDGSVEPGRQETGGCRRRGRGGRKKRFRPFRFIRRVSPPQHVRPEAAPAAAASGFHVNTGSSGWPFSKPQNHAVGPGNPTSQKPPR